MVITITTSPPAISDTSSAWDGTERFMQLVQACARWRGRCIDAVPNNIHTLSRVRYTRKRLHASLGEDAYSPVRSKISMSGGCPNLVRFPRVAELILTMVTSSSPTSPPSPSSSRRSIERCRLNDLSCLGWFSSFTPGTPRVRIRRTSSRASSAERSCGSRSSSGTGDGLRAMIPST